MDLTEIFTKAFKRKKRKRRGRGQGSGLGGTSGRGTKGAKSRSGYKARYAYEGGQMPLVRRMPKRGFSNEPFRKRYDVVNLSTLEARCEDGARVVAEDLDAQRIVRAEHGRLKVLGSGELKKSLTVVAHAVSKAAREKIEAAGGKVELVGAGAGEKKAK
jgi:large subunit ribosomal protein L15